MTQILTDILVLKTTRTARLCRFHSAAEKEHEQNEHSDETKEKGPWRAIPLAESYV